MKARRQITSVVSAMLLAALACGPLAPPEDCGVGGVADEAKFAELFTSMELVNAATGAAADAMDADGRPQFASADTLAVKAEALSDVSVRVCVMETKGGGKIVYDQISDVPQVSGQLSLGLFKSGSYVARVAVDGTLVKNLTFSIK